MIHLNALGGDISKSLNPRTFLNQSNTFGGSGQREGQVQTRQFAAARQGWRVRRAARHLAMLEWDDWMCGWAAMGERG